MITSLTFWPDTLALRSTSCITTLPRSEAFNLESDPLKLPVDWANRKRKLPIEISDIFDAELGDKKCTYGRSGSGHDIHVRHDGWFMEKC